jgi:hypothetical protein
VEVGTRALRPVRFVSNIVDGQKNVWDFGFFLVVWEKQKIQNPYKNVENSLKTESLRTAGRSCTHQSWAHFVFPELFDLFHNPNWYTRDFCVFIDGIDVQRV